MKKFWYSFIFIVGFGVYAFVLNRTGSKTDSSIIVGSDNGALTPTPVTSLPGGTSAGSETLNPGSIASSTPTPAPSPTPVTSGQYTDGTYTGSSVYVFYGYVQVRATVAGGKLSKIEIVDYPQDRDTSRQINREAMPLLISEAISAQNAQVDTISGASDSSEGFRQSLSAALAQAKS